MKKLFSFLAIVLFIGLVATSSYAVNISADGNRGEANRILTTVFNDSGGTLTSGTVVIWDTGESDDGLGAFVNTTTSADSNLAAGVIKSSSILDQSVGTIIVYGPAETLYAGATDASTATAGTAVGTTTVVGQAGDGTGLGVILLDGTDKTGDGALLTIFINPSNAE